MWQLYSIYHMHYNCSTYAVVLLQQSVPRRSRQINAINVINVLPESFIYSSYYLLQLSHLSEVTVQYWFTGNYTLFTTFIAIITFIICNSPIQITLVSFIRFYLWHLSHLSDATVQAGMVGQQSKAALLDNSQSLFMSGSLAFVGLALWKEQGGAGIGVRISFCLLKGTRTFAPFWMVTEKYHAPPKVKLRCLGPNVHALWARRGGWEGRPWRYGAVRLKGGGTKCMVIQTREGLLRLVKLGKPPSLALF